jgi:hypothetical protein
MEAQSKSAEKMQVDKQIHDALTSRQDLIHEHTNTGMRNLSRYVTPYTVNRYQSNLLAHIIGKAEVSKLEEFNALAYAGLINVECTQAGVNERYVDPFTGRVQCRKPSRNMTHKCPGESDVTDDNASPFNIEPYIDADKQRRCRKPVRSGQFSCPQPDVLDSLGNKLIDNSLKRSHVTLPDGTGICVDDYDMNKYRMMPTDLVHNDMAKISNYISLIESLGLDGKGVSMLNETLKSPGLIKMKEQLLMDPDYSLFTHILRNIYTDDDQRLANIALYQYNGGALVGGRSRRKHPKISKNSERSKRSKRSRHPKNQKNSKKRKSSKRSKRRGSKRVKH